MGSPPKHRSPLAVAVGTLNPNIMAYIVRGILIIALHNDNSARVQTVKIRYFIFYYTRRVAAGAQMIIAPVGEGPRIKLHISHDEIR